MPQDTSPILMFVVGNSILVEDAVLSFLILIKPKQNMVLRVLAYCVFL